MTSSLHDRTEFPCESIGCERLRAWQFENASWCFGVCPPNEYGDRWVECYTRNEKGKEVFDISIYNDHELDCRIEGLQAQKNYCPLCEREKT